MKINLLLLSALAIFHYSSGFSQSYPTFGPEKKVTITGLTFDAMEPFISLDGNVLYFNSLNSGGNTNLYYATIINDTIFNYTGLVGGAYDPSPNHLDAVASLDLLNNFFWTSLRGYPTPMENLHRGVYSSGNVSNITRVYGDFNIYSFNYPFGWLIMDAAVNYQGDQLYYCNAKFDFSNTTCVGVPCESRLGVAQKFNDSTFNKLPSSDVIFGNINDTVNYIIYAPQVTMDGLELYYTRLRKGTFNTEICVSIRNTVSGTFSLPMVIHSNPGFTPEAASPTTDKQKIYYHQKDNLGVYRIFLRNRAVATGINVQQAIEELKFYPNPINNIIGIVLPYPTWQYRISVFSSGGKEMCNTSTSTKIDVSSFANGIYLLIVEQNNRIWKTKIVKE